MIPTLLQQLRTQPIRARLQAAFVLLFVLMLVVIVVSVSAMRNTLDTLTGFREEVMPELARVLELADAVDEAMARAFQRWKGFAQGHATDDGAEFHAFI